MKDISQAAQDKMRTAGRAALQQNTEAIGEITRERYSETADRTPTEVDEVASGPLEPAAPSLEAPNAVGELSPSPALESPIRSASEAAVNETDEGSMETSSRVAGALPPSAPAPSSAQEEAVTAEELPPTQEEESLDGGVTNTTEKLPPPPEVSDVELSPPPPVPQNVLDELPPPPTAEALDEPAAQTVRREVPRVHVRRTKATAAARSKAEEVNVDLAEVEGTGRPDYGRGRAQES